MSNHSIFHVLSSFVKCIAVGFFDGVLMVAISEIEFGFEDRFDVISYVRFSVLDCDDHQDLRLDIGVRSKQCRTFRFRQTRSTLWISKVSGNLLHIIRGISLPLFLVLSQSSQGQLASVVSRPSRDMNKPYLFDRISQA